MGDRVREFEQAFARMHEAEDSIAVGSCTTALHLILHSLGIGPGDEVLVASLTFVAMANSVLYVGARPVFVDIGSAEVPLMSLDEAEAKCTSRTKAVIMVHFAGYLAHRDAWQSFARRKGLLLIEDAAHAPGLPAIALPGVGTVEVSGLTPAELQTRMETLLQSKILRQESVSGDPVTYAAAN